MLIFWSDGFKYFKEYSEEKKDLMIDKVNQGRSVYTMLEK